MHVKPKNRFWDKVYHGAIGTGLAIVVFSGVLKLVISLLEHI